MNELQKYMLEKQISLKQAKRLTGKDTIYCRQAMSGQLSRQDKMDEFLFLLKSNLSIAFFLFALAVQVNYGN